MRQVIVLVVSILMLASSAAAHSRTTLDGDDSPGPLDLVAARHSEFFIDEIHSERGDSTGVTMKLVTFEKWTRETVAGQFNFVGWEFNLDGDAAIERCVLVQRREVEPGKFRLEATIYKRCSSTPRERVATAFRVWREDRHSIKVEVMRARRLLGRDRSYAWRAVTSFQEQEPRQKAACEHRVYAPPAPLYGTCADFSRWKRHSIQRRGG